MIYFIQTGLDPELRKEQVRNTLHQFGLEAAQMYRGNVVQIPSTHKLWEAPVRPRGAADYIPYRDYVWERRQAHMDTFGQEPAAVVFDHEPEMGPNGEAYLITDAIPPVSTRLDIDYRIATIEDLFPGVPLGHWGIGKHLGRGTHSDNQKGPVEDLLWRTRASVVFPNYYPRKHNSNHEEIVDNDYKWWTETLNIPHDLLWPCVQYRVKHAEPMEAEDAEALTSAVLKKYGRIVIWMQAEVPSHLELWDGYHRSVALGVQAAIAKYTQAPGPEER